MLNKDWKHGRLFMSTCMPHLATYIIKETCVWQKNIKHSSISYILIVITMHVNDELANFTTLVHMYATKHYVNHWSLTLSKIEQTQGTNTPVECTCSKNQAQG